jgi:outer membrane biosynthesis protein TonB
MLKFIERNKFSLIATLIVHVGLYVWFNIQIIFKDYGPGERVVAVLDFSNDEPIEEPEDIQEEQDPEDPTHSPTPVGGNALNVTANAAMEKTTYTNTPTSFNKKSIDQQVWEELKAMESAEFSALGGTQKSSTTNTTNNGSKEKATSSTKENGKEINPNLVKSDAEKNDNANYGDDVQAIASFNVPGRSPLKKATPSYKCKVEGTVRVLIKVDQKGKVLTPEIDESKTNTQNICLREEALDYVRKWVFNQDFTGPLRVSGWIEFKYVSHG